VAEGAPRRGKGDPLAVAVYSAALLLLAGLVIYVVFFFKPAPVPESQRRPGLLESVRQYFGKPPAKASKPAPPVAAARPVQVPVGKTWRYSVAVEPQIWRDITLSYRTVQQQGAPGVQAEFRHAGGQSSFHLGTLQAGHPSHANTRFPGFFLYAAYLRLPLEPGQKVEWSWPWQQAGGKAAGEGRLKRFEGRVAGWETVVVPAGKFQAARIEGKLEYVEGARVRASASETLWFAPDASQLVKIVREGRTPDESAARIAAELAELR